MSWILVIACFALLLVLLSLLGVWQQKISAAEKEHVLAHIRSAQELGTALPLAQHPQIDVQACIGCGACIAACPEDEVLGIVDGVARVIHGSRCIGHARCAVACPVAAIAVGLGELAKSPNLPILSPRFETSVPGIYVAGELGGFALIRIAIEQGVRAIQEIAQECAARRARVSASTPGPNRELDVLIVGAGPAGLAASLKAREHGLRYLAIDQDDIGGTVRKYPRRKLTFTGQIELPLYGRLKRQEFLKEELIELWEQIIRDYKLQIRTGVKLESVARQDKDFVAQTSAGVIRTRNLVLALGRRGTPRKLGVPGEAAEKVLYQLLDAATYTNSRILVVGGGDSAVETATALASQAGNIVTLSYRRANFFRLKPRNLDRMEQFQAQGRLQVILSSEVKEIALDHVVLATDAEPAATRQTLGNDFVFVMVGGEPPYPLLRGMGVKFNGDDLTAAPIPGVLEEAMS